MPIKKEELNMLIKEDKKNDEKGGDKILDLNGSLDISPINNNLQDSSKPPQSASQNN